jgi:hypothetical protein
VSHEIIPTDVLHHLRDIGDPDVEDVLSAEDAAELLAGVRSGHGLLTKHTEISKKAFAAVPATDLDDRDTARLMHAQGLFATYGTEISGALLLAALPQSYAAQWASRVLVASSRLQEDFRRRILGTSQFLVVAMRGARNADEVRKYWTPGEDPLGQSLMVPWKACLAVRLYHQAIRVDLASRLESHEDDPGLAALLGQRNDIPINQEDLLATLLTFTVTVFEVLERYGISWTADDQEAYLFAWDLIGRHLGVGSESAITALFEGFREKIDLDGWHGFRPPTIVETRRLLDQLRERQWSALDATTPIIGGEEDSEWEGARSGRVLVRALLNELTAAMPARMQGTPLSVMRALAPAIVRQRLSLGGGGIVLSLLDLLPKHQAIVDRFTSQPLANPVGGGILRMMANQVTTHVIVHFIRAGGLRLPSLEEWSDGLPSSMDRRLVP